MKKALLVGNGMTSQLIESYQDNNITKAFKQLAPEIYEELNNKLLELKMLPNHNKETIIKKLKKCELTYCNYEDCYNEYFIKYNLLEEIKRPYTNIEAIETLLKTASLFQLEGSKYKKITIIANKLYFNNGNNGLNNINSKIDKDKLIKFINTFDDVYTTNYDFILDDCYDNEVQHLHGGFNFLEKETSRGLKILKVDQILSPDVAHLIWGLNASSKRHKACGTLTFANWKFGPDQFFTSDIDTYFEHLRKADYDEFHIWGFSGLNDAHISDVIKYNTGILNVLYYDDPNKLVNLDYCENKKLVFSTANDNKQVKLYSWDTIWNNLK